MEEFPLEVREAVEGLIHLGSLSIDVEFCGHSFGLRTLRAGEELAASSAMQKYRDTLREPNAWAMSVVGLALTHVDGDEDFCPQAGPDLDQFAKARLNYLSKNWYWPTINFLFQVYGTLLTQQNFAFQEMQSLSQRTLGTSLTSPDSSDAPVTLNGETAGAILDSRS